MQGIAMLSTQIDRAPQGGHFSAMNGKNNTTAVVLFLPQGLQLTCELTPGKLLIAHIPQ